MTTGLVIGMTLEEAGIAVRDKAIAEMERTGSITSVWTESGNRSVLVGIARRGKAATTMLIPLDEYDGMKLLELLTSEDNCDG